MSAHPLSVGSRAIRLHNDLITASFRFSALELDIFFYVVAQLRAGDGPGTCYRVYAQELAEAVGRKINYQQFWKACQALRTRELCLRRGEQLVQVGLAASVEYHQGRGYVEVELSEKIRPYLFELTANFTSFCPESLYRLRSQYAKRIYLLLAQWADKARTRAYSESELRSMLGVGTAYASRDAFRQNVLNLAVEKLSQLAELTDVRVEETRVGGRYVVRFYARWCSLPVTEGTAGAGLPVAHPVPERQTQAQVKLRELGIVDPAVQQTILTNPGHVAELFKYAHQLQTQKLKSVRNPAGLFLHLIGLR